MDNVHLLAIEQAAEAGGRDWIAGINLFYPDATSLLEASDGDAVDLVALLTFTWRGDYGAGALLSQLAT